eukprot:77041-Rhodomonas_salina.1
MHAAIIHRGCPASIAHAPALTCERDDDTEGRSCKVGASPWSDEQPAGGCLLWGVQQLRAGAQPDRGREAQADGDVSGGRRRREERRAGRRRGGEARAASAGVADDDFEHRACCAPLRVACPPGELRLRVR